MISHDAKEYEKQHVYTHTHTQAVSPCCTSETNTTLKIHCVCVHAKSLQPCQTLCDPTDYSLPGSSVHGILQAGILEWDVCPPPGDLLDPGIEL